jgi:hypothetical protein
MFTDKNDIALFSCLCSLFFQSAVFFLGMRATIGHKYNIDWDAFVHAILSGFGSAVCIYLNYYAAVHMTGITG